MQLVPNTTKVIVVVSIIAYLFVIFGKGRTVSRAMSLGIPDERTKYRVTPQVIKPTSYLPIVGGSLRVLRLLPPLINGRHDIAEIMLKVALKHQKSKSSHIHR
jgi:hypothetical protein